MTKEVSPQVFCDENISNRHRISFNTHILWQRNDRHWIVTDL